MTCGPLEDRRHFGIICRFHLQGRRVNQTKTRVRRQVASTALRLAGCWLWFVFKSRIKEAHAQVNVHSIWSAYWYDHRSELSCRHVCLLTAVDPTRFQHMLHVTWRSYRPIVRTAGGHCRLGTQEGVRGLQYRNSSWDPQKCTRLGVWFSTAGIRCKHSHVKRSELRTPRLLPIPKNKLT
jgi:hypothetical protein